jgi:hypothetical protein
LVSIIVAVRCAAEMDVRSVLKALGEGGARNIWKAADSRIDILEREMM